MSCSLATLFGGYAPAQGSRDWRAVTDRMTALFRAQDYHVLVEQEPALREELLSPTSRQYTPAMYLALSFQRLGCEWEALPYFEKGLSLRFRPENLTHYREALVATHLPDRGLKFIPSLRATSPEQSAALTDESGQLRFFSLVEEGDRRYLRGDRSGALAEYQKARKEYAALPLAPTLQAEFFAGLKRVAHEYTIYQAYDAPDGYKRRELLVESFLEPKIALCAGAPSAQPIRFRVAALVVRNTDLEYSDRGRKFREKNQLTDAQLVIHKNAWRFACAALQHGAKGKIAVDTTYFDLPGVVLTGLQDRVWKELIHVRHLDPAQLRPTQELLFRKIAAEYDGVVFIWPRGRSARAYGGGAVSLPVANGSLPARACIKSLPATPALCLHELLHNFEKRLRTQPVHGPRGSWATAARAHHLTNEVDWYLHLVSSVPDWSAAPFRRSNETANENRVD